MAFSLNVMTSSKFRLQSFEFQSCLVTKDRKTSDLRKITVARKCCPVLYVPNRVRMRP